MNRRQQRYFLLTIILLSFFLLGQNGERKTTCDSFRRCGLAAAQWHVRIDQRLEGCSDASTSNQLGINVADGRTAEFELTKGNCSSVGFDNPEATGTYNITYMENDTLYVDKVKSDLTITLTFYGDCSGEYLLVPLEECPADETPGAGAEPEPDGGGGGAILITDGEPVNLLPEDEVYPPEPELELIEAACWASGTACSPVFSTDSRCCSGYCAEGACW